MTLKELIISIDDKTLSKEALEEYRDNLCSVYSKLQLEASDLEKLEAIFMSQKDKDTSVAETKIHWRGSTEGLRLIEVKRYLLASKEMISSLKSRIYDKIY